MFCTFYFYYVKIKTFLLFRQKRGGDVECPPVYSFLYRLMNKAALACGKAEYNHAGRDRERE